MSQYDDYMRDFHAVANGNKPAVIVERRKSREAYLRVMTAARADMLPSAYLTLADSTGQKHPAFIVGKTADNVRAIANLLRNRDHIRRDAFQITMGSLLGYPIKDCIEYTKSRLSKTCGCELCGGPTPESRLDDLCRLRRTTNQWG